MAISFKAHANDFGF